MTVLISAVMGVDRLYLAYTGVGLPKLFMLGGPGIRALVDTVLISLRNVPDSHGRPLR